MFTVTVSLANTPFVTIDTAIFRSSHPLLFCKKGFLRNYAKFTRKHQKKEIPPKMFSCKYCEISHNTFFKEHFGWLLLHKHSLCLLSHHDLLSFQKRCHTYFLAEYFLGLNCRLGTGVSPVFQTLSQKPIFNPVKHLQWNLFAKIINSLKPLSSLAEKAQLWMFYLALNTTL